MDEQNREILEAIVEAIAIAKRVSPEQLSEEDVTSIIGSWDEEDAANFLAAAQAGEEVEFIQQYISEEDPATVEDIIMARKGAKLKMLRKFNTGGVSVRRQRYAIGVYPPHDYRSSKWPLIQ